MENEELIEYDDLQLAEITFQCWMLTKNQTNMKYNSSEFYRWVKQRTKSEEDFKKVKPLLKQCWYKLIADGTIPKEQLVRIKL